MYTVHSISQALCIRFTVFPKHYHYVFPKHYVYGSQYFTSITIMYTVHRSIIQYFIRGLQIYSIVTKIVFELYRYWNIYNMIIVYLKCIHTSPSPPAPIFQIFQSICATPNFISWIRSCTVFSKHYVYIRFTVFPKHYIYGSQYYPRIVYIIHLISQELYTWFTVFPNNYVYSSRYFLRIMYMVHSISQELYMRFAASSIQELCIGL